jgi:hypothetical protein
MRCDRGEFVIRAPPPVIKPGRIQKSKVISSSNLCAFEEKAEDDCLCEDRLRTLETPGAHG